MKTFLKWGLRVLGGLLGIAFLGAVGLYFVSESIISRTHEIEVRTLAVPDDAASIEQGRKVALTRGCLGCHDRDGSGQVFIDSPMVGHVAAPNLTRLVRERSVAELDRGIRQGLREDGKSVVIMPSGMFHGLSDEDFTALIAYLKTLPLVDNELPPRRLGPMARFGLVIGQFETERQQLPKFPQVAPSPGDPVAHGKYLAVTTCTECHGPQLAGRPDFGIPDLIVAAAYSPENFIRLMRTGEPQGDRELNLMKEVAEGRFKYFSDEKLLAMHSYFTSPGFLASRSVDE